MGRNAAPHWSAAASSVSHTPIQAQALAPISQALERRGEEDSGLCDVYLCYAWGDRAGVAKELRELLVAAGVKVWFSEEESKVCYPMISAINRGLARSRIVLILITPALLARIPQEAVAEKELSALLGHGRLVPIVHDVTYEVISRVSPVLGSQRGFDAADDSLALIARKISELVASPSGKGSSSFTVWSIAVLLVALVALVVGIAIRGAVT